MKHIMQPSGYLINWRNFYLVIDKGRWWFRIFHRGISCKNIRFHSLDFSERQLNKGLKIGKYLFHYLDKM